jgi:MoaA/NifB/PqqE/SkfB family radical SAM enzyme
MLNKLTIDKIEQISIEMDGTCNLRCPMCPQSWGREEEFLQKMDFNLFKSVIDQAVPHGLKYVILSGSGEPLKNKNLEEAIVYLRYTFAS